MCVGTHPVHDTCPPDAGDGDATRGATVLEVGKEMRNIHPRARNL